MIETRHEPSHQIRDVMTLDCHAIRSLAAISQTINDLTGDIIFGASLKLEEAAQLLAGKRSRTVYRVIQFKSMARDMTGVCVSLI
jgi:hypothetical protein